LSSCSKENIIDNSNTDILPYIQTGFPVMERPFAEIADKAGKSESDIIVSILSLIDSGVIRAFGPVFEAKKLGYTSTLAAAKVDPHRLPEIAAAMLGINEITHNYVRNNDLNMWFTITALSQENIDFILKWVEKFPGIEKVISLPSEKVFKIKAVWGAEDSEETKSDALVEIPPFDNFEKSLVRALQKGFPIEPRPFASIAARIESDEATVINNIKSWTDKGVIRRFGARLNHRRIGYNNNILVAWKTKHPEEMGKIFSELPYVSHCYMRTPHKDWPYEIYTMIHSKSNNEGSGYLRQMTEMSSGASPIALKTLYELKKTTMKYFLED
jgi:siroheme decarboxylase